MKNQNLAVWRICLLALIMSLLIVSVGCRHVDDSDSELIELSLADNIYGVIIPTASGYETAPLSEFEVIGYAKETQSGKRVKGSWSFAQDQDGIPSEKLIPEEGKSYTIVFTPENSAELYSVLTTEIVPEIIECAPTFYEFSAQDVHALYSGELTFGDININKGTIFPSGSINWLDEKGHVIDSTSPITKGKDYRWQFVADGSDGLVGIEKGWTMEGRYTPWPSFISGTQQEKHGNITYSVYVPDGYDPNKSAPLYIYLHGCGSTIGSAFEETRMKSIADAGDFLVLMPQQSGKNSARKCWNWFTAQNSTRLGGEPEQVIEILNSVCESFSVDKDKIFVGGLSAGGYFANTLAATYPDVFSGVMVNAGGAYFVARSYAEGVEQMTVGLEAASGQSIAELADEIYAQMGSYAKLVPMVVVQGLADEKVYPQNGFDTAQCWAEVMHRIDENISTEPIVIYGEAYGGTYTLYTYYNEATAEAVIKLYMVDGLEHTYARGAMKSPDAVKESFDFFMQFNND